MEPPEVVLMRLAQGWVGLVLLGRFLIVKPLKTQSYRSFLDLTRLGPSVLHLVLGLLEGLPLEVDHFSRHRIDSRGDQRLICLREVEKPGVVHICPCVHLIGKVCSANIRHAKLCLTVGLV